MDKPQRILLVQLYRVGDALLTTPAIRAVREAHPNAQIDYLTQPPNTDFFENNPHIYHTWHAPKAKASLFAWFGLVWCLRKQCYDVVIDFSGGTRSCVLCWLSAIPTRIGPALRGRKRAYTHAIPWPKGVQYSALHKAELVKPLKGTLRSVSLDAPFSAQDLTLVKNALKRLGVEEKDLLVVFSPVSRQPYKRWSLKHFSRLADVLIERWDAKVLLLHGPGEDAATDGMRLEMLHTALPEPPNFNLPQTAALLRCANLLVGNDNGIRHIAIAQNTPTVAVFGRTRPSHWTPPNNPLHQGLENDIECKNQCHYPRCERECLSGVRYQAVEKATESLLENILKNATP